MTTEVMKPGIITRVRRVVVRSLLSDGTTPEPAPQDIVVTGVSDVPLTYVIQAGEQVIDRADGVGVIAVHTEDDTLVGVDLNVITLEKDFLVNAIILGGRVEDRQWFPPTIGEQREAPARFSVDIYSRARSGGYLVYKYAYCMGVPRNVSRDNLVAVSGFVIKARPHPKTQSVYHEELVDELPNI